MSGWVTIRTQTVEKASQNLPRKRQTHKNRFWPRRTPGWPLLPLRGNSPSVRGQKHISGCKCGICSPSANKLCAQQTAKIWRKAPKGIFDTLKPACEPFAGRFSLIPGYSAVSKPENPLSPVLNLRWASRAFPEPGYFAPAPLYLLRFPAQSPGQDSSQSSA